MIPSIADFGLRILDLRFEIPMSDSAGGKLRDAVKANKPLQIVGTINAYCALLAQHAGHRALYLSGAGAANASHGLPDLGVVALEDILEDARRITSVTDLPLLVDADTGWGGTLMVQRGVRELTRAGVAGMHIEDQIADKRCGHRPNKQLCSTDEMVDRIKAATDGRMDKNFVIMARTDAAAVEGLEAAIARSNQYMEAGADMIFAEALTTIDEFRHFTSLVNVPVLANMTEFGKTPLLTTAQLRDAGVAIALYPLSAFRAMSRAASNVYQAIARDGTQQKVVDQMQTREELYDMLGYHELERQLDARNRVKEQNRGR
jgi:methylisocitrate lyase